MPTANVIWFFEQGDFGWSEKLWTPYVTDLVETQQAALKYATLRLTMCGDAVEIKAIRVSDDIIYRDALLFAVNYFAGQPPTQGASPSAQVSTSIKQAVPGPPDQPYSAIQVRMESGSLYRRQMMMRGNPDEIIIFPGGPSNNAAWNNAFKNWASHVIANYQFRCKSRAQGFAPVPVTSFTAGSPPQFLAPGLNAQVGQLVQLVGFRGFSDVRYTGYVATAVNDTYTLKGQNSLTTLNAVKGFAQRVSTSYQQITTVQIRQETHRVTGRPFAGPVGRRRRRA